MAKMTHEEWAEARRKWEEDPREGFKWLAEALGGRVARQVIQKRAIKERWAKGGTSAEGAHPVEEGAHPEPKSSHSRKERERQIPGGFAERIIKDTLGPGRPTLYFPEYCEWAYRYCLLGATNEELAEAFQVTMQTILNWMDAHPKFFEAVQAGKLKADARLAEKLYVRAHGYTFVETRAFCYQGQIITKEIPAIMHPEPGCLRTWLYNRQPKRWKARPEEPPEDLGKINWDAIDGVYDEVLEKAEERHRKVVEGRVQRLGVNLEFVSDDEDRPEDAGHDDEDLPEPNNDSDETIEE
jgi:hypothetical protein